MGIIRTILAVLIAVGLAFAPAVSAFAAPQGIGMQNMAADAGASMDGMDCEKAVNDSANGKCQCCDTKSMCPDKAACMTKCGNLLGVARLPVKIALPVTVRYLSVAPDKPPNWRSIPPSPPPRF